MGGMSSISINLECSSGCLSSGTGGMEACDQSRPIKGRLYITQLAFNCVPRERSSGPSYITRSCSFIQEPASCISTARLSPSWCAALAA